MTNLDNDQFFQSDEFKGLLKRYEEMQASGVPSFFESEELTNIAEYYQDRGETDKALDIINEAIELYPGALAPLLFRARFALLRENAPDLASEYAEKIEDKTDLEYYYLIAEIMLFQHRDKEAAQYLDDLYTEMDEEDLDDFVYDVIVLFLDYGQKKYAQEWMDRISIANHLDHTELQARIESAYGSLEKSEEKYLELIDADPYSADYWYNLASVQFVQGKLHDAQNSCEFAIAITPTSSAAVILKANTLFAMGRDVEALDYYKRYCEMRPGDPNGPALTGATLTKMRNYAAAISHYEKAIDLAKDNPAAQVELYIQTGLVYSHMHKTQEALRHIGKAGELPEANPSELKVQQGYVYLENNQPERAARLFREAIGESGNDAHILYEIGVSTFDNRMYSYAYEIFKQIAGHWTSDYDQEGWGYYAACCQKLGKTEEFMNALETACRVNPLEVSMVFDTQIPDNISPRDYYNYIKDKQ